MPDLLAGTTIRGLDTPPTVTNVQDGQYTFTIAAYGTATTSGSYQDCAVVFTAPTTGRVMLTYAADLLNSTSGATSVTPNVREGGTVGSGTEVVAADDTNRLNHRATASPNGMRADAHKLLTGLTPGNTYNARLLHQVSGGTGTARWRSITASPAT